MRHARLVSFLLFLFCAIFPSHGESLISAETKGKIDKAVADLLASSGAPSASIAVVTEGRLAYAQAYGAARLDPRREATPAMRYRIGSISKQFTAACVLLLAEEGKISLDDELARWFPELTRARDITVRQLLSMTSGYQDFWPQDYVMPMMLKPVQPQDISARWGQMALNFDPGSKWQYSNTNYVIAGMIVEKITGVPFFQFLQKRILTPLQMTSAINADATPLGPEDAQRYLRYAGGPLRVAPKEGRGWMFGAGELAMTASDLAKWNISLMNESLLRPESYRELEKEIRLTSGVGTGYGLGVGLSLTNSRRRISHGGEVSGFTAANEVYPDDKVAVAVFTNMDATNASQQMAAKVEELVFGQTDPAEATALAEMKKVFASLQKKKLDRSLFTANANAYFSEQAMADFKTALGPLGTPKSFEQSAQGLRGGMSFRRYDIKFPAKTLRLTTYIMPNGKIEQYQIAPTE